MKRQQNSKWLFNSFKAGAIAMTGTMFLNAMFPIIDFDESAQQRTKSEQHQIVRQAYAVKDCANAYGLTENGVAEVSEAADSVKCKTKRNHIIGEIK